MSIYLDHDTPVKQLTDGEICNILFHLIVGLEPLQMPPRTRVVALFKQYTERELSHPVVDMFLVSGFLLQAELKEGETLRAISRQSIGRLAWEVRGKNAPESEE